MTTSINIQISRKNHELLKDRAKYGETMDDVITSLLAIAKKGKTKEATT